MIPYIDPPTITLLGREIALFTVLVTVAVISFLWVADHSAQRKGLSYQQYGKMALFALLFGGLGARVVSLVGYYPDLLTNNGGWSVWLSFQGVSSVGAMSGGLLGTWLIAHWQGWPRQQLLHFVDSLALAAGIAWVIGRAGCAVAHDHLGPPSSVFWAVAFPDGPRLDLGLLEFLALIPLVGCLFLVDRYARRPGMTLAFGLLAYGLMRFGLDFFRTEDLRIAGFTAAQYICVGFVVAACLLFVRLRRTA